MANQTITPAPATLTLRGFTPKVIARGRFNMSTVMDAIAAELLADGVTKTAYGYPVPQPTVPCAFVAYPSKIDWIGMADGNEVHAVFPIFFVVGKVVDKTARDNLSLVIDGAQSIKNSLDGNLSGSVGSCTCDGPAIELITIGDVEYLAAKFELDLFG